MINFKQYLKEDQDRIKWSEFETLIKNTFGLTPIYYKSKMSHDMVDFKEKPGLRGDMFGPCCGHSMNYPYLVVTIAGWAYYYDEEGKKWYIIPENIFGTRHLKENPFPNVTTQELDKDAHWDLPHQKPPLPGSHIGGNI